MKKLLLYILVGVFGVAVGAAGLFVVLRTSDRGVVDNVLGNGSPETTVRASSVSSDALVDLAIETVSYIKAGDFNSLANVVHPIYGLYISPDATVNLKNNQCFTTAEVADFQNSTASYVWGLTPGSTIPLEMSVEEYFKQYVYDNDYLNAQLIGINYPARTGNSLENVTEIFPNAQFVDLCFPGTQDNSYQDWSILRLVYEEYEGSLRLTAIIHSAYTP